MNFKDKVRIANGIREAMRDGVSDADIFDHLTNEPVVSSGIEAAQKDGVPQTDILAHLANFEPGQTRESYLQQFNPANGMSPLQKAWVGFGSTLPNLGRGLNQATAGLGLGGAGLDNQGNPTAEAAPYYQAEAAKTAALQSEVDQAKQAEKSLGGWGMTGKVAGNILLGVPAMMIPGANTAVGSALVGAGIAGASPTATGESRMQNMALGAAGSLAGFGIGTGLGKIVSSASQRMSTIEGNVAAKAAADAAAETASARSAAGNAAQNAYRQLEHLRELNAKGLLNPEQATVADSLEKELSGKAAEKLLPAAAQKEATSAAYSNAMATEAQRAGDIYAEKLGGDEVKRQIMARVKRYGPAAAGGMIGNMLFPGVGGMASGAATGLVLRPAIRSMMNLAKNPAVQHGLLSPIANMGLLENPYLPQSLGLLGSSIYAAQ